MSSVPASRTTSPARRRKGRIRVEPTGPALRVVTEPPELYPGLVAALRVVWFIRHAGHSSREVAERGRETGARL